VTIQIDTREQIPDDAAPPAPAVGLEGTADRRRTSDGPTLRDLVGDWTWRSHDDDQQLPSPHTDRESASTTIIRVFARARLLVGY
jgi:hypothetical protein